MISIESNRIVEAYRQNSLSDRGRDTGREYECGDRLESSAEIMIDQQALSRTMFPTVEEIK